jgi:hypothetical protein
VGKISSFIARARARADCFTRRSGLVVSDMGGCGPQFGYYCLQQDVCAVCARAVELTEQMLSSGMSDSDIAEFCFYFNFNCYMSRG